MPKTTYAKPFDVIRDIKQAQTDIKNLSIKMPMPYTPPGVTTAWATATLVSGWTGTLSYRKTQDNELQLSANRLIPGTTTDGTTLTTIAAFTTVGNHDISCVPVPARMILIASTGVLTIAGASGISTLSFEVRIPLDL